MEEQKEATITFGYDVITPEKFVDLKIGFGNLLYEIFDTNGEGTFEVKLEVDENFSPELLDAYIESLENDDCTDYECEFNYDGECLNDDSKDKVDTIIDDTDDIDDSEEPCGCPYCKNEELQEALGDLNDENINLIIVLKEKDEKIKYFEKTIEDLQLEIGALKYKYDGTTKTTIEKTDKDGNVISIDEVWKVNYTENN